MQDLKITLVQSDLHWSDPSANMKAFANKIAALKTSTDIILLPEMFTTGFTMDAAEYAESMEGDSMNWMAEQADKSQSVIVGSLIIKEGSNFYNRLIWMDPGGMYQVYDKRHLFAMAGENESYTQGTERIIISHKGWRICPMICYDLRFPVWSRNNEDIDLLIYIANWPNKRSYDWITLLKARAIENQCYVVGVNRVGQDDNGHDYSGNSCVIDPGWQKVIWQQDNVEVIHTTTLDRAHLQKVRSSLPFLVDMDEFAIL